jgi:hypothetical protein
MTYVKLATLAVFMLTTFCMYIFLILRSSFSPIYLYMLGSILLINEKLLYYMLNLMPNFPKHIRYMHRCVLVPTLTSFAICSNRPDKR